MTDITNRGELWEQFDEWRTSSDEWRNAHSAQRPSAPSGDHVPDSSPLQNPLWVLPVYPAPVITRRF